MQQNPTRPFKKDFIFEEKISKFEVLFYWSEVTTVRATSSYSNTWVIPNITTKPKYVFGYIYATTGAICKDIFVLNFVDNWYRLVLYDGLNVHNNTPQSSGDTFSYDSTAHTISFIVPYLIDTTGEIMVASFIY